MIVEDEILNTENINIHLWYLIKLVVKWKRMGMKLYMNTLYKSKLKQTIHLDQKVSRAHFFFWLPKKKEEVSMTYYFTFVFNNNFFLYKRDCSMKIVPCIFWSTIWIKFIRLIQKVNSNLLCKIFVWMRSNKLIQNFFFYSP